MIVYIFYMVDFVFRLQQQVANIRRTEEADEQVLHQKLLSEEESTIKSQRIYIREKVSRVTKCVHLIHSLSSSLTNL